MHRHTSNLLAGLLVLCSSLTANAAETSQVSPDVETLLELPTADWLTNGGDLFNRNFSALTEINTDNVHRLGPVWRTHLDESGVGPKYSGEAQPIIHEGVMYVVTGADDVFALGIETGEILWSYRANLNEEISTVCCGWTSRGVGLGEDKIFVGQLDGVLKALDIETGEEVWSIQAEAWEEGYTITSAPLYFNGMVITGFAGAEFAARGRVKAYSSTDGTLLWTFYTVPGPGEFGHDTWPADSDAWRTGGGTVWHTPAVDPELGMIYFSTGNPGPDYNGAVRAGDNLFTASIVALDAYTGEYRWHFQQVHHDIWDYDAPNPVVLFDLEYDGVPRKGLAQAGKTGWVYILDRTNGEPLVGIEERPVPQEPQQGTAATQPYPLGDAFTSQTLDIPPEGYQLINNGAIFTPFWEEPVMLRRGEANWPPSTVDPGKGVMYVCAGERQTAYTALEDIEQPDSGNRYTAGGMQHAPLATNGVVAAMDLRTNRRLWAQRWPGRCYSGLVSTAGDLLFAGRNDGRLTAMDSRDGTKLWEFMTDAGVNAPPAVFEHNGKQYVAVFSAGNLLARSDRGDSMWLFTLLEDDQNGAVARGPVDVLTANPEGQRLFFDTCQFCHGGGGEGGHSGIPLEGLGAFSTDYVANIISNGQNNMPAFSSMFSAAQIRAVAEHVRTLNPDIPNRSSR
jgi:quinohemoprotein ethanol dehydrogenase